ncbi:helix-turn-helix domain-containing protein [Mucilaginibacter sp. CAU 1740]|jgi:transcriptional regulator with XRE-family HTH domain|uniref:helix-turn-helix domain-containing protein n=1 Tax=Mucilaginibacter sp. CAU 1740 TaxID=3140365 RepID=UPI00325C166F
MEKHSGQIIEYVIRKKGFNISDLARSLNINRRSLYNWFNQKDLSAAHIFKIGNVIRHDFSVEFPELFSKDDFKLLNQRYLDNIVVSTTPQQIIDWEEKYLRLLEEYNNAVLINDEKRLLLVK